MASIKHFFNIFPGLSHLFLFSVENNSHWHSTNAFAPQMFEHSSFARFRAKQQINHWRKLGIQS